MSHRYSENLGREVHYDDYTTDPYGNIAVPNLRAGFIAGYADKLPVILGAGAVRQLARDVANDIITTATDPAITDPVVWITGNSYMPPMRSLPDAEYVYQAENNRDGDLWEWFVELVEDHLSAANVLLECPEFDNALYAVDLNRWQYKEPPAGYESMADDLNDEWEPVDPDAVDDNAENPRE